MNKTHFVFWVDARLNVSSLASFVFHKNLKTKLAQWWAGNLLLFYWLNICHGVIAIHIHSTPCRFCGNILLWGKKMKNNSNCTFYELMKIWSNFDRWKVQNYHLGPNSLKSTKIYCHDVTLFVFFYIVLFNLVNIQNEWNWWM